MPISDGYRPLCLMRERGGSETPIGLCELHLADEIQPGTSGNGCLTFAPEVSSEVTARLGIGSRFVLTEGPTPAARAQVLDIVPDEGETTSA